MRAFIVAVLLLLTCTPLVHAQSRGFSAAEKDETRKAYEATKQMHLAIENLGETIRVATGTTARTALADVWAWVNYLTRETGRGSALLIGISTAMTTFAEIEAREAMPRATWVSDALVHHDNAIGSATAGIGAVDTALAVGGQVAAYTTKLTALRANLTAMSAALSSINRTYTYLGARNLPFCRDASVAAIGAGSLADTKNGPCNVFGPHGNWIMATQQIQNGWAQLVASDLVNFRLVYTANDGAETVMPDSSNASIADMMVDFARLTENMMVVMFNFAVIPVTTTQCTFTPLRLVMRSVERILQFGDTTNSVTTAADGGPIAGMPFFWAFRENMAAVLDGMNAALATRPVTHGLFNTVISERLGAWRLMEGGFWLAFEMPSDLRNVIIDGSTPGSPTFGTLTFPYYFGVTRSSDLRVYVRNAGSGGGRTPQVEGVDYTVTGVGNPAGGSVTFAVAPPSGQHVQIERVFGTRLEEIRRQPYPENDPTVGTVGPCS